MMYRYCTRGLVDDTGLACSHFHKRETNLPTNTSEIKGSLKQHLRYAALQMGRVSRDVIHLTHSLHSLHSFTFFTFILYIHITIRKLVSQRVRGGGVQLESFN